EVSPAQLGRILARNGISLQRTRSWKQSPGPDYGAKSERILALYREQPKDGVVISFDEKGPESLCPKHGRGWARRGRPERHLQPPPGDPLPGRCARGPCRLPADQAAATPQRRLHARVYEADPARVPEADPPLLDP